jgi:NAD(P)H-dependent flavin oxidoreductase YrpB (nitropropane dioxygenase family)
MSEIDRRRLLQVMGMSSLALAAGCVAGGEGDESVGIARQASTSCDGLLSTRLTQEYGVTYPLVAAGMGFVALADLTAAVTNAGGIGVIGSATMSPPALLTQIQAVQSLTSGLFGVDYLVATGPNGPFTVDAHIDVAIQSGVKLAVFFWDTPTAAWVDSFHASGAKVWFQASSLDLALAAADLGVDAIVTQGSQAGGHCRSTTPTLDLLDQVIKALGHLPVLAAGGIADGQTAATAFAHGADGVWVGTRFVASTEAYAHTKWKNRIVQTQTGAETARTTMFGPEWPDNPIRVLRNTVVNQWVGRESQIPPECEALPSPCGVIGETIFGGAPYAMPKFSAVLPTPDTTGDFEQMCLPAGLQSAPLVKDIKPAGEIVVEMMRDAQAILQSNLF